MKKAFILAAVGLAVAGCSDPKAANESNFKAAIQQYLDSHGATCLVLSDFPAERSSWFAKDFVPLVKAGVLTATEPTPAKNGHSPMITYDLTDLGRKHFKPDQRTSGSGEKIPGLCVGRAEVVDVEHFSEPADMMGHKLSQVRYTYVMKDLPDWARQEEVVAAFRGLKKSVEASTSPTKDSAVLVLTNKGWLHESLFKE